MPANSNNQGLLSSWKEIARYLDCDERTCRRYEINLGLPVHRMEGSSKSRIYAYKDELDAWRKERLNGAENQIGKAGTALKPARRRSRAVKMWLWLVLILAVVLAGALFLLHPSPGQPSDFRIQGSKLIILDDKGKELWVFDSGLPNLEDEKAYRAQFQVKSFTADLRKPYLPCLVMKDINRDGKVEVLFSTQAKDDMTGEGEIFCFGAGGDQVWHQKVGRQVEFGGRTYSADFRVGGFDTVDIDDDGNLEILIFAFHYPHSPTQLLILDSEGKALADFFNFGQMHDFLLCDLDGDGRKELLVTAQNDEYGKGCLIVFDASRVGGCSPQITEYPGEGFTPGTEKYYILFPRTDVDLILFPLKESMHGINLLQNGRIQLNAAISQLYFELDAELRPLDVKGSDYFRDHHRELKAAGKITSVLDDAYYEKLKKGVLYWDGTEWTSTPTMNRRRQEQKP
ncbi:MAG: VCBS repeat-containing protein [Candidatus Aminicenantales bacterium]